MVKQGYKQTEIGLIPEDWEVRELGEFCFITKLAGFEYSKYFNSYKDGGDVIVVRGTNITNNKLDLSDVKYIPRKISDFLYRSKLSKGDLVFAYVGTIGPIYLINEDNRFHLGPNTAKIRIEDNNISTSYIYSYFLSENIKKEIDDRISIGAQPSLSMTKIRDFSIILPPLPEQEAIASALSDADAWIESLAQLIAKKRLIKQGAMQELLTPPDGTMRGVEPWEVKKLGEVVKIAKSGGTPLSSNKLYYDGSIPFLSISDMTEQGKYLKWTSNSISQLGLENSASWIVPENSIIYSMYASVGFVSINKIKLATSQAVLNLILKEEYNLEFIYYILVSIQSSILKFVGEGTQKNLNAQSVKDFDLNIPSLSEQTRIATILSDMDAELEALEQKLSKARQIKQGMMQELLTGRVRLV